MDYFIIRNTEDGIRVSPPMTLEGVSERLRMERNESGCEPVVLPAVPEQDHGCFMAPDGALLILRGEVVTLAEVTACPCGSGKAFKDCHGAEGT